MITSKIPMVGVMPMEEKKSSIFCAMGSFESGVRTSCNAGSSDESPTPFAIPDSNNASTRNTLWNGYRRMKARSRCISVEASQQNTGDHQYEQRCHGSGHGDG